jgi:hypothetical protein
VRLVTGVCLSCSVGTSVLWQQCAGLGLACTSVLVTALVQIHGVLDWFRLEVWECSVVASQQHVTGTSTSNTASRWDPFVTITQPHSVLTNTVLASHHVLHLAESKL